MIYYVAGGAVRDLILGRALRDVDYIFDATEEVFIQRNPSARKTKDQRFPIYLLEGQEYSPLGTGDDAIGRNLRQRDFTMNALLLSPEGVLHAHPLSLADLQAGLIRPSSPSSLRDDPVRALRAARFSAHFTAFSLHADTLAQMRALPQGALAGIAAEQAGNETKKACAGERPGNFLRTLAAGNCLLPWFAEFVGTDAMPAGPQAWHDSSVLEHTARVMDATAAQECAADPEAQQERSLAVWMALCHDLGKSATPKEELPRHIGHELRGEGLALAMGRRLRLPGIFIKAGGLAARLHMKAANYAQLRPGTKVDLLAALHGARLLAPFTRMAAADSGQPGLPAHMHDDLQTMLGVALPPQWQDKGEASGRQLRELRCRALTAETPHSAARL